MNGDAATAAGKQAGEGVKGSRVRRAAGFIFLNGKRMPLPPTTPAPASPTGLGKPEMGDLTSGEVPTL